MGVKQGFCPPDSTLERDPFESNPRAENRHTRQGAEMGRCQVLPFCFCSETIPFRFIRPDTTYFVHTNRGRPKSDCYTLHRVARPKVLGSPMYFRSTTANYLGKFREPTYPPKF